MKMQIRQCIGLAAMLCAGAFGSSAYAEIPHPPMIVLTSDMNSTQPEETFGCAQTIYAFLTFPKPYSGRHTLEGVWFGPQGDVVQHSMEQVVGPATGQRTAYIWMTFSNSNSGMWHPFSVGDPQDSNRATYDGKWHVEVRWDDQTFTRASFDVKCQNQGGV